jgi:hypothetical protein
MAALRDPKFLKWIKSLPCSVPACTSSYIEAAHTGGHGIGIKAPDRQAIPLCGRHHRSGNDSLHSLNRRKFELKHGIDINGIVAMLNAKPRLLIEGNWYVAHIEGFTPVPIGQLDIGIRQAIRCTMEYTRDLELRTAA